MKDQTRFTSHSFNMVEIILAMVIILVGVLSMMALFPVGGEATQSAIGRNNAGDAGDQFLRYFSSKVKTRWAITNVLPMSKPGPDEGDVNWQSIDASGVLSGTHSGVEGIQFFYNDIDNDSKFDYKYESPTDLSRDETGLFMIVQRTAENVEDFAGVIRVWKTAATYSSYDTQSGTFAAFKPVPPDAGISLNIEVSWPAQLPYDKREKATYSTNVFRPSEYAMEEVLGAFQIKETGKLKVTYHGSDAGWKSSFNMLEPIEQELFPSNKTTDQTTTFETEYRPGTSFNFFIETTAGCCGYGSYDHYAWSDDPVECECTCRSFDGALNLNPSNSTNNEFNLRKASGGWISRDDLHEKDVVVDENGVYWQGKASYIKVRPKGNGNQNTFLVDGVIYLLRNSEVYIFEGDMDVVIYNDHVKQGRAMGHWWLGTNSACARVHLEDESHDELCPKHPAQVRLAKSKIPYFDNPPSSYDGAFHHATGNPYCLVTDLEPGRKWLLRFEDLPGDQSGIDWDYNDVVVTVELLVEDGVNESLSHVPVSGTVTLNPNGGDWRVSLVKTDGTMITDASLAGGYDGEAITIWFRPGGTGSQDLTVDNGTATFTNDNMISVSGENLQVRVYQSGSLWKADIVSPEAFYTVMQ